MSTHSLSPSADVSVDHADGTVKLSLSGQFTAQSMGGVLSQIREAVEKNDGTVEIDFSGLERLDTSGALALNLLSDELKGNGRELSFTNTNERYDALLEKSRFKEKEEEEQKKPPPKILVMLNSLGKTVCDQLDMLGQMIGFLGVFLITFLKLFRHPSHFRFTSLVFQIEQVGLRAVPIVGLLTFLIGMVVAYMGAQQLQQFGAQIFAVQLLEMMVMREMAVLITSIVVAGRSSSSFTAQIGAMIANEEVDALRSMGLDPNQLLVVPRVLAILISLPMLTFIADMAALAGGAVALSFTMGLSFDAFLSQFQEVAELSNFFVGIVKTPFFAIAIGVVGCFQGFRATSSAESVGFLTTISVVQSIFIVILLDALFAIFFTSVGI